MPYCVYDCGPHQDISQSDEMCCMFNESLWTSCHCFIAGISLVSRIKLNKTSFCMVRTETSFNWSLDWSCEHCYSRGLCHLIDHPHQYHCLTTLSSSCIYFFIWLHCDTDGCITLFLVRALGCGENLLAQLKANQVLGHRTADGRFKNTITFLFKCHTMLKW